MWILLWVLLALPTATARQPSPRHCGGQIRHVTLSVGPDARYSMIVSFASLRSDYKHPIGGVLVGTSPSNLTLAHVETEPPTSYNLSVTPGRGNVQSDYYFSPHYHHITVTDLKPNTTYFYKPIVHSRMRGFSQYKVVQTKELQLQDQLRFQEQIEQSVQVPENENDRERQRFLERAQAYDGSHLECPSPDKIRTFTTAPNHDGPVSIAVFGDIGQFTHSEETMSSLLRSQHNIDALILAGDVAYPRIDHRQWDTFMDFLDDYVIASHKPIMMVPGNHDIDKQELGYDIFLGYEHRFRMPRVRKPVLGVYPNTGLLNMDAPPYPLRYEYGNAYYAWTYGPARFVMVNAYASMEPGSIQYKWLQRELQAVDRSLTPWLVVVIHVPLYNTFSLHRKDLQILAAKEHVEPLLVEHHVNLVFTGHIHAYSRTEPVAFDVPNEKGPIHITAGAGGRKCEAPFRNAEPEPWVAVRDATVFGYGMFRIFNATHAQWDWVHTGHPDDHDENQLYHSDELLPPGPDTDRIMIENQYFLE